MNVFKSAGLAVLGLTIGLAVYAYSAEPSAPSPQGSKKAEFDEAYAEWRAVLADLSTIREEYPKASAEKKDEMANRYNGLLQKGEAMRPRLLEVAEAALREDPKANPDAAKYISATLNHRWMAEDYETALRAAKDLLEVADGQPMLHALAGTAAYCAGDFDLAEKELKLAGKSDALSQLPGEFGKMGPAMLGEIPFYKAAWQKEQAIRAAEAKANDLPRVLLKTSKGDIEIELLENEAPNSVANFISLVEKGFYNGTPFHRVLPQFMAQGGDPTGTGGGGPGYSIACECYRPDHRIHFRGTLSMAHAGRDTGGSQFFLTFRPTHHLDGRHTVFGRVIKGMEVLSKLQRRDPEKPQADPDKILEAKVLRKRPHPYEPKKIARASAGNE